MSFELEFNLTINQWFEKPFFNLIITFISIFSFASIFDLRSYEQKINTLTHMAFRKIKLKSNSVLWTDAISLKKTKLWLKL